MLDENISITQATGISLGDISPVVLNAEYVSLTSNQTIKTNNLDFFKFLVPTAGAGVLRVKGQTLSFAPGDLLIVPPKCPCTVEHFNTHSQFTVVDFHLHNSGNVGDICIIDHQSKYAISFEDNIGIPFVAKGIPDDFNQTIKRIFLAVQQGKSQASSTAKVRLKSLMTELICCTIDHVKTDFSVGDQEFLRAVDHIDRNYTTEISVAELARICHTSPSYFSFKFKKKFMLTPIEYINLKRITLAKSLLSNSQASLRDVATQAGFDDYFYFSRIFKKYVQASPLKFKRQNHQRV